MVIGSRIKASGDSGIPINPDAPYALASVAERQRRTALLAEPHMKPLMDYLGRIRQAMGDAYEMPAFDPLDGGINARALLLLEAPGPKAVGSGFISRNNPDPTARNICRLLAEANIPRQHTLIWNIVPWYVGDGQGRIHSINGRYIRDALPHLGTLIGMLPELKVILLLGKKAGSTASPIRQLTSVPLLLTHHPSARVFNVWPEKWTEAKSDFARLATMLGTVNDLETASQ